MLPVHDVGSEEETAVETGSPHLPNMGYAVEQCVEEGISPHDSEFQRLYQAFGEPFVDEYVSEVATHMAYNEVQAFEYHDMKEYPKCAESFKEVYRFLFDITEDEADNAGHEYTFALRQHDQIEDKTGGIETDGYDGKTPHIEHLTPSNTTEDLLGSHLWKEVNVGFDALERTLDLPSTYTFDGEIRFDSYARNMTEFFKYHTVANEAEDAAAWADQDFKSKMRHHAKTAQIIKFSKLMEDDASIEAVAKKYLQAVNSHDAHTMAEQWRNVERMTDVYRTVLREVIEN